MDDVKDTVNKLGYSDDKIKTVYLCRPDLPFEDNLATIESDKVVRKVIGLLMKVKFVCA